MTRAGEGTTLRLLTVAEVADALRVSSMTIYRLIKTGDLPAVRVGKSFRIRETDLKDYLTAGVVHAEEAEG
jgi:excisionase family DNA binding protein